MYGTFDREDLPGFLWIIVKGEPVLFSYDEVIEIPHDFQVGDIVEEKFCKYYPEFTIKELCPEKFDGYGFIPESEGVIFHLDLRSWRIVQMNPENAHLRTKPRRSFRDLLESIDKNLEATRNALEKFTHKEPLS